MHIVAFGASGSKNSINKTLAAYAANQFAGASVELLDLNDYPLPLYTIDLERESGIPAPALDFYQKLRAADLLIISLAEHNGTYTSVFKNLFDWVSRRDIKMFAGKPLLLMATATGNRGGQGVMDAALIRFPIHGASVAARFILPRFMENFHTENGIVQPELKAAFDAAIAQTEAALNAEGALAQP